ncbi:MAG TPA: hypothetical protein VMX75_04295 [Spirochaetia bacterium]|nr:hypothetical protein [Spirochaetia bacterium]
MKKIFILLLTLTVVAVVGCVSLKQQYHDTAEDVIELINKGETEKLSEMTQTPFILDGEIIILKNDMASFWQNIVKADFKIEGPTVIEASPANEETYKRFAGTMEVETYFKKYLSDKGHVIVIETDRFMLLLLMDKTKKGKIRIIGFKGPDAI